MRLGVLCVFLAGSVAMAEAGQRTRQPRSNSAPETSSSSGGVAEAYDQYLRGRLLEREENIDGAIAAFKRAAALDPTAGDVLAELSALYMRQNRVAEAMTTAEQALKVSADSVEAHRVLGTVYAALSDTDARASRGQQQQAAQAAQASENATKAIEHLEQALRRPGEPDPNVRANLARMYIRLKNYDKAIPVLRDLVTRERGWPEGVTLLTDAYTAAGKTAEAIAWLEEAAPDDPRLYATLADFYERERRWQDAAGAYAIAVQRSSRNNVDLKLRYASALLNAGGRENMGRARDLLADLVSSRPTDQRAMYLLSQSQRRSGDSSAAEATARRLIALNKQSPWGYYALAEALQDRQQFQVVVDTLNPALKDMRSGSNTQALGLLLPHLGFAYEQLGEYDQAIAAFDEAHKIAPTDALITSYLIQANLSAKKYAAAQDLAQSARAQNPDDLRLARLHAQALRQTGQPDRAVAVMQELLQKQADRPVAYVAMAQVYQDANRGADAVKVLDEARLKFPTDVSISFELGAILEKQKRYADAEAAFRQVLTHDPDNAPTLNYLGYMLADRGERLDESVGYLKKALQIDPENGSYLDSLGWAYFKSNKFDLAADNLQRAAGQLKTNSVIQDHYGEVLFKLGRYDEAIDAWTRALAGDGDSIDRGEIDKKIRTAQQKLKK
jgi:tetratricopeptide (TPR) repeat protein